MRWTKDHDLILLKKNLLFQPYSQKRVSPERGRVWEQIAKSLNGQREDKILFKVSQRSVRDRFNVLKNNFTKRQREEECASGVRDRFNVLKNNFTKRQREEECASGVSPEIFEVDECLEDIHNREVQRKR